MERTHAITLIASLIGLGVIISFLSSPPLKEADPNTPGQDAEIPAPAPSPIQIPE
jgi:hypothetical protein